MKKYNYKDDFEMIYLRHEYLRRCDRLEGSYVKEFSGVVHSTARIMYDKLKPNFDKVGFQLEDIAAITNVYLLGYMGIYSFKNNKEALEKFIASYKIKHGEHSFPTEAEINRKDRNNLINFLRQKLQHCSVICSRKARNIIVGRDKRGTFAYTKDTRPATDEKIIESCKEYGYRKVTNNELKEIRKKARENGEQDLYDKDGFKVIQIEILSTTIKNEDYALMIRKECITPEMKMVEIENKYELEMYKEKFKKLNSSQRRRKLKRFIDNNDDNRYLKKEISLAKKILSRPKSMV